MGRCMVNPREGLCLRLRLKSPRSRRIVVVFFTILVSFFFAESVGRVALRLAVGRWHPLSAPFFNRIPVLRHSSQFGWEFIPKESGVQVKYGRNISWNINTSGLRESEEYDYARTIDDQVRVLVLGDSFTAGDGVEESCRWTELVEASVAPRAQLINAGVPAYAADQELLWYQSVGVQYEVDAVVFVHFEENLVRIGIPYFAYEPRFLKPTLVLREGQLVPLHCGSMLRGRIELSYRSVFWYAIERLILHPTIGSPAYRSFRPYNHKDQISLLIEIFKTADEVASAHKSAFYVLYLPASSLKDLEERTRLEAEIRHELDIQGIQYFSAFRQHLDVRDSVVLENETWSDSDVHWNEAANRRFAQTALPFFQYVISAATDQRLETAAAK